MRTLTLIQPDDWHVHLRDGTELAHTVPATARCFARAIVMPNLSPPVVSTAQALAYRERILQALPAAQHFEPLMTLYLTEATSQAEIRAAAAARAVHAVKLYPAGATTNSESGVKRIERVYGALEAMAEAGMPLLVHGEVTDPAVDVFDREQVFIDRVLEPLVRRFPTLKVVLEHVTTAQGVQFVQAQERGVAATITAHHLLINRNALFSGGLRPHHYCLPVAKRESHRLALLEAATSGDGRFFLGTDSAPHPVQAKESACGCAGIYSAPAALELYAEAFDAAGALEKLEGFASVHGPAFYAMDQNCATLSLRAQPWQVPERLELGAQAVAPFRAGESVAWRLVP